VNLGKGVALKRGLSVAKGDIVVALDADGSHQPEEIPQAIYCIACYAKGVDTSLERRRKDM